MRKINYIKIFFGLSLSVGATAAVEQGDVASPASAGPAAMVSSAGPNCL